jgi:hypothetical protein
MFRARSAPQADVRQGNGLTLLIAGGVGGSLARFFGDRRCYLAGAEVRCEERRFAIENAAPLGREHDRG